MTPAIPSDSFAVTTEEDRKHLCTYAQAYAGAPDCPRTPMHNGRPVRGRYRAMNETTGHGVYCADLLIASGYVCASRHLRKNEVFSLRVGDVRVDEVEHHPAMRARLADKDWFRDAFSNYQYFEEVEPDVREYNSQASSRQGSGTGG